MRKSWSERRAVVLIALTVQAVACSDSKKSDSDSGGSEDTSTSTTDSSASSGGTSSSTGGGSGTETSSGGQAAGTTDTPTSGGSAGAAPSSTADATSGGGEGGTGGASTSEGSGGSIADVPLPPELTWTAEGPARGIVAIWGSGATDIYTVGPSGGILHSAGDGTWTTQSSGTSANLTGIWGSGPDNIYISADSNAIRHSVGDGEWTSFVLDPGYTFRGIWGSGPNDIYLIGPGAVHYDGSWRLPPQDITGGAPVLAIWGSSSTDIYVGTGRSGSDSNIYHSVGDGSWQAQGAMMLNSVQTVWGHDATHVYAGGDNTVFFSSGDGQWSVQLTTPEGALVLAGWSAHSEAAYACTQSGTFYRSNGQGLWSEPQVIDPDQVLHACNSVWGTGPDNIYLGTNRGIYHGTPAE